MTRTPTNSSHVILLLTCGVCILSLVACSDQLAPGVSAVSNATAAEEDDPSKLAQRITVSSSPELTTKYANSFDCECYDSRKEIIVKCGVSTKPSSEIHDQFAFLLNVYTGKRLLSALSLSIERHEQAFGKIPSSSPADSKHTKLSSVQYINFVRVSSTPEELILEGGLNPTPYAQGPVEIVPSLRVVMLHKPAKDLTTQLMQVIDKYEQEHGVIETDVRKRVLQ